MESKINWLLLNRSPPKAPFCFASLTAIFRGYRSIIDYTTVRLVEESYSISGSAGEIKGTIRRKISSASPPTESADRVEQFDDFNNVTDVWPKVHSRWNSSGDTLTFLRRERFQKRSSDVEQHLGVRKRRRKDSSERLFHWEQSLSFSLSFSFPCRPRFPRQKICMRQNT